MTWLYAGPLDLALDKVTWLEPTRVLRQAGWQVTLIVAGRSGVRPIDGQDVLFIPWPNIYMVRQIAFHILALEYLLRNWHSIDLILFDQASVVWMMPLLLVRAGLRRRRPLLVKDTRSVPMELRAKRTTKDVLRGSFHNLMDCLANHWVDGQTAITPQMAEILRIPRGKLWGVWPSGVRLEEFSLAQRARRWPVGDQTVHLVYTGALHPERNLSSMCDAVRRANSHGMNFAFSMVGEGRHREALTEYALRSHGKIKVLAPVPHCEIPALLSEAHVGVLPFPDEAKFRVSSPIKLFEYMGAGLPILATHITCHTDVIGDGEYAFWAQDGSVQRLYQALSQVWQRRSVLPEMGGQAAEAAKEWTWQASAYKLKVALERGLVAD
jgi:glycosyltransferase involved in cell wall biosynthesis